MAISIVIPVINESDHLAKTLTIVHTAADVEVIVVDGGSEDDTVQIAQAFGVVVIQSQPGRAVQMNAGAAIATFPNLLFLHADTCLPIGYDWLIHATLAQPGVVAGAFDLAIAGSQIGLRLVEWGVKWRSHWLHMPYGDQGLFLKAEVFHSLGGFPNLPIMEDVVLMRRLNKLGRVAIAAAAVSTSSRRWQTLGIFKTTFVNQLMIVGYFVGISPATLAQWYRSIK
ncbi:TIGR04283 family arsenosugar biosynthesis glycosyltransferase [Leptolyngbya sp. Cla-17]|uniref:TIGR04283 family arsenosugar biosynthesis glycosyltransferase n=1 Tax=Leptolyngbya sp. Cla-17 TaxID=2803751 RepID=UPI0018D7A064|nr:TIGR04283 family arsenosugar biosynthesis glycosyltransferase [Leptolyngbya sp. Cla-17]